MNAISVVVMPELVQLPREIDRVPEERAIEILASDRPVHHVAHELERPVDRGRGQRSKFLLPMDPARLLQIGDEVFDVGRPDVFEWPVTETID